MTWTLGLFKCLRQFELQQIEKMIQGTLLSANDRSRLCLLLQALPSPGAAADLFIWEHSSDVLGEMCPVQLGALTGILEERDE